MSCVITGMGAVAAVGGGPEQIFTALCAGTSGLTKLRAFDLNRYRAHHAYEIDDRTGPGRDEPLRATRWLVDAVEQACADGGLTPAARVPVLLGTTLREQRSVELWWRGEGEVSAADLHFGPALRRRFGFTRTYTFANACAATLYALGLATDLLDLGMADAVVVAGTDAITESAFGTLDRVQNRTPEALRPFDRARAGMLMGEGASAVVVRRDGDGDRPALARIRGVSMNCDAYHPTAPDPAGIAAAMHAAHTRAGLGPDEIDLVMLHGSGTELNDAAEATALHAVFGDAAARPLMTAIKSMTGHTLGGSGLLSLIVAVLSLHRGVVPPIAGLTDPADEAAGLRLVSGTAATAPLRTAQVDAFGFGGINAVAVVERS
ncbi:beta-ketoacyl-[acyl-carrier-protein] synthase family protein [Jidongwangia harbinensis]|uniref:beta-ketoacyl-[acyl-carrier-protein] synthase family protein n=1 Tax=Jidongwangia harbinensis TaxID=2878561 RepID=UPI001CDA3471|nr:beta-ketoacyl synthase N-terminal-like domain-containing protein [Jidongwangia harbinensis]MCA2218256.1 beta-ketoacyl synthase [Jidongwangia harbinensis]